MEDNIQTDLQPNDGGLTDGVTVPDTGAPDVGTQDVPSNDAAKPAQIIEAPEALGNKDLWDSEKGQLKTDLVLEELNRQTKRAEDLRQKLSKGVDVPKKAEEYEITPEEELKDIIDPKAEVFGDIKELALKNNMSKEQLNGFINGYMKMMVDKGLVTKPMSQEEAAAQKAAYVAEQKKQLGPNADGMIKSAVAFIEAEHRKGIFSEAEKQALMRFADAGATGISVINKLREMAGQPFIPMDNAAMDGLAPDREILANWDKYSDNEKMNILQQRQKLGRPTKFME